MIKSSQNTIPYYIGLLMPYLAVWLGLYIFQNGWAAILLYHAGIAALVTRTRSWPRLDQFRLKAPIWTTLLYAAAGCSAGLLVYLLWPFLHASPKLSDALLAWGLTPRGWPLFIVYSALVNPWLEESYWRGWLGSAARHPIFRDAAFAGFHLVILAPFFPLVWLAAAFVVLAFAGWMWRQVNRAETSMLASTLFHMAADVSILLAVWSTI